MSMSRSRAALGGVLLLLVGAAAGAWIAAGPAGETVPIAPPAPGAAPPVGEGEMALSRRVEELAASLAAETAERRRLEERLASMEEALVSQPPSAEGPAVAALAPGATPPSEVAPRPATESGEAVEGETNAEGLTPMQRALYAAGVDAATVARIKQRADEATLSELYLRDQAEREEWLDTPLFHDEMKLIREANPPIRDEIGDDAYDRYLSALGEPNRVTVEDVLGDSVAADAGMQVGDMVLRYGDERVFTPNELVAQTRGGTAGELVQVDLLRNGQLIQVEVPRGPLGLRIAAGRGSPFGG